MFKWLLRKNIEDLIDEGEYAQAVSAIHDELAKNPPPFRSRPLRERLAEVLAFIGETPSSIELLRELIHEYLREHQTAKAIALQKKILELSPEGNEADEEMVLIAAAAAQEASDVPQDDLPEPTVDDLIELTSDIVLDDGWDQTEVAEETVRVPPPTGAVAEPGAALATTPLFGDFSSDELQAVIREMKLLTLDPGEVVMVEGDTTRSLYVLTHGTVQVYVRSEAGRSVKMREIDGVAFFGEISIVSNVARTATITCKSRCDLLELDLASVLKIAVKHPRVKQVLKEFCERRSGSPEEVEARKGQPVTE